MVVGFSNRANHKPIYTSQRLCGGEQGSTLIHQGNSAIFPNCAVGTGFHFLRRAKEMVDVNLWQACSRMRQIFFFQEILQGIGSR